MSLLDLYTLLILITALGLSACTVTAPSESAYPAGTPIAATPVAATSVAPTANTFDCASISEIPAGECRALLSFYKATSGPEWLDKGDWLETTTPCTWLGITCSGDHVDTVALFFNNLQGQLPESLTDLTHLRVLDLHNNAINGEIPEAYGRLSNLEYLDLSVNQLAGPIPEKVGDLAALQTLNLAHNQLSGALPEQIGQLSALRSLELSHNSLIGPLPASLGDLAALETLRLRDNHFEGEIPFAVGSLSALSEVDLTFNALTGPVPSALFEVPLHRLWANTLEGTILAPESGPQDVNYLGAAFTFNSEVATSVWPELVPARPAEEGPGIMWGPGEHIVFTLVSGSEPANHAPLGLYLPPEAQILVFPTAGLNAEVQPIVDALQELLADPANLAAYETISPEAGTLQPGLPMLPPSNAAQMVQSQLQRLEFAEGSGVRYLTQLSQGPLPVNNQDLFYTFQGLTANGATYVAAFFPVSFPVLPDSPQTSEEEMAALMSDWQGYLQGTETLLDEQPSSAFAPDLAALDALIRSLSVAGTTALPAVEPVSPQPEAVVGSLPLLQWESVPGAAAYHVVVLDDIAYPPQVVLDKTVNEPQLLVERPLAPGHYSYTVWAKDEESHDLAELTSTFIVDEK